MEEEGCCCLISSKFVVLALYMGGALVYVHDSVHISFVFACLVACHLYISCILRNKQTSVLVFHPRTRPFVWTPHH